MCASHTYIVQSLLCFPFASVPARIEKKWPFPIASKSRICVSLHVGVFIFCFFFSHSPFSIRFPMRTEHESIEHIDMDVNGSVRVFLIRLNICFKMPAINIWSTWFVIDVNALRRAWNNERLLWLEKEGNKDPGRSSQRNEERTTTTTATMEMLFSLFRCIHRNYKRLTRKTERTNCNVK